MVYQSVLLLHNAAFIVLYQ